MMNPAISSERLSGSSRSGHIWAAVVLTLALAAYYGWQVVFALSILAAAGQSPNVMLAAYLPAGLIVLFFVVAAFAVYRGYRWSLFLYQIAVVLSAIQLLLTAQGTWDIAVLLATNPLARTGINAREYASLLSPIVLFAVALYNAIVVYRQIYTRRT